MMCLAPLILAGLLITQDFNTTANPRAKTDFNGAMIEAQTCERGAGLDLKASSSGLYGLALQYGAGLDLDGWAITITPKAGLAYVSRSNWEQAHPWNFEVGGQVLIGRDRWRIGFEYWHISNAYLSRPNTGIDTLAIQTGWIF